MYWSPRSESTKGKPTPIHAARSWLRAAGVRRAGLRLYERHGYEGALPRWGRHEADAARYEGAVPPMLVPSAQPLPPVAARRPQGARANLNAYYVAEPKRA